MELTVHTGWSSDEESERMVVVTVTCAEWNHLISPNLDGSGTMRHDLWDLQHWFIPAGCYDARTPQPRYEALIALDAEPCWRADWLGLCLFWFRQVCQLRAGAVHSSGQRRRNFPARALPGVPLRRVVLRTSPGPRLVSEVCGVFGPARSASACPRPWPPALPRVRSVQCGGRWPRRSSCGTRSPSGPPPCGVRECS